MNVILQVFLPLSLAFIMFSMGLALTGADFKRVAVEPKAFAIGAFFQIITLPLIAFGVASVIPMAPEFAVGVMILAACPGGVTSNLLTHLARGDTALSVSLTAVISIVSVFTIPLIVNFGLQHFSSATSPVDLPILKSVVLLLLITTVPLLIGMAVKWRASDWADRVEPRTRRAAAILFIVIVLGAISKDRANLPSWFTEAGPAALVLNLITMALAFGGAMLLGLNARQRIAITLECGLQNSTLAIAVAATLLANTRMMVPAGIYGLLMFVTAGLFIYWSKRSMPEES